MRLFLDTSVLLSASGSSNGALDRLVIFPASKDRPILFTALATADVLLTLDQRDFASLLGGTFYGMRIQLPEQFFRYERGPGRLQVDAL